MKVKKIKQSLLDENKAQTPLAQVVLKVKDCVDNYNYNQDTIATLESRLKPDEEQFLRQQALEKKDELQQLFDKK
jgi:energy-converting hydrogenase A subunit M